MKRMLAAIALAAIALPTAALADTATAENIQSGKYPIWSYEHIFTKTTSRTTTACS